MTAVPEVVRAAARPVTATVSDKSAEHVRRGDVRLIRPLDHEFGAPRFVLVIDVDRAHEIVDVVLVHSHPDLATESDVIVPKEEAATQFPVVIQSDLRSAVWKRQLGGRVGHLQLIQLEQVNDSLKLSVGDNPQPFATGLPLEGPADGRWEFKRFEGDELRRLATDCSRALLEDDADWELDPRMIVPGQSGEVLVELMHWLDTRTLCLSEAAHEFASEVYAKLTRADWGEHADLASSLIEAFGDVVMAEPVPRAEGRRRAALTTAAFPKVVEEFDLVHFMGLDLEMA